MDQFFTNKLIAQQLFNELINILEINEENHLFLEPSAGDGSFSDLPTNCLAYDLQPMKENITKQDFLQLNLNYNNLITIGNPPFGKRTKLAVDFFNHASQFSEVIAMIFPNQFNKYNTQNKLNKNWKLIYTKQLDDDVFYFEDKSFNGIRCVFQIWVKEDSEFDRFEDLRISERPVIKLDDVELWQHNGTVNTRKFFDKDWKYATYRQGYKDYTKLFDRTDYNFIKDRVYNSSDQFFFMNPLTDEAENIIKLIDFENLANQNTTTRGFGKADFCAEYLNIKNREL